MDCVCFSNACSSNVNAEDTIFWLSPPIESCNWIDFISVSVAYASWYHWNSGRTQHKAATINQLACPSYCLYVQLLWYPMYYIIVKSWSYYCNSYHLASLSGEEKSSVVQFMNVKVRRLAWCRNLPVKRHVGVKINTSIIDDWAWWGLSGASTSLRLLILQTTSSWLVQLRDGQISDQQLPASCAFLRTKTVTISPRPRAFAVSSPTAWNNLSVDLQDPNYSLSSFRKKLKTHLFKISSTVWGFCHLTVTALLAAFETFLWKASDNNNNNWTAEMVEFAYFCSVSVPFWCWILGYPEV